MQQQVSYLAIGSDEGTMVYDAKTAQKPLFLTRTGPSTYSATLVEGNFSHVDISRIKGSFEVVTASEILRGYVALQMPDITKAGEPESFTVILEANAPD